MGSVAEGEGVPSIMSGMVGAGGGLEAVVRAVMVVRYDCARGGSRCGSDGFSFAGTRTKRLTQADRSSGLSGHTQAWCGEGAGSEVVVWVEAGMGESWAGKSRHGVQI